MADENVTISVEMILDDAAKERVISGASTTAQEVVKAMGESAGSYWQQQAKIDTEVMTGAAVSGFKRVGKESKVTAEQAGKNWEKFWTNYEKAAQRATITALREQGRILILSSRSLKYASDAIGQISRATAAAGVGIVAGIFAGANKYIKDADGSTKSTREWLAATEDLKRSQAAIGSVLVQQALPAMRQVANLARVAANFVSANPQLVKAGLNVGLVLATVGTIGIAVARGIKLVADVTYIAGAASNVKASQIQLEASLNQLTAAGIQAKASGGKLGTGLLAGLGGGAAIAGIASTVLAVLTAMGLGAILGTFIYDVQAEQSRRMGGNAPTSGEMATGGAYLLGKLFGRVAGLDENEIERKATVFAGLVGRVTKAIDENSPLWLRAATAAKKAGGELEQALDTVAGSKVEKDVVGAYMKYREELANLETETGQKRVEIAQKAADAMLKANQENASAIAKIWADFNSRIADLTSSYNLESQRAYEDYLHERQQLEQEQGQRELDIRKRLQKKLRDLEQEHNDKIYDLASARDALGIVRENRDYRRKRREAEEEAGEERRQLRQETRKRLQELEYRYELEAARRKEDFERQLAEAAKNRDEELKAQQQKYEEDLRQLKDAQERELRDLEIANRNKQNELRKSFVDQINDLDTHLTGETDLKREYYALMLADVDRWLAQYRAKIQNPLGTPTTPPTPLLPPSSPGRALGGYASGLIRTGEQGIEYVVNAQTTRALEALIGGKLTQQNLLGAVANGRAGQVVWNDQRRFSGEYTAALRRQVRKDSEDVVSSILQRAF